MLDLLEVDRIILMLSRVELNLALLTLDNTSTMRVDLQQICDSDSGSDDHYYDLIVMMVMVIVLIEMIMITM